MMRKFWLLCNEGMKGEKLVDWNDWKLVYLSKFVIYTLLTKFLMYLSVILFSLISAVSLLCSIALSVCAHTVWNISQMNVLQAKLSTEACDSLEMELILSTMKTGKHIQSDWQVVNISTVSGLECLMRLHSLIYIGLQTRTTNDEYLNDDNCNNDDIREGNHTSKTSYKIDPDEETSIIENKSNHITEIDGNTKKEMKLYNSTSTRSSRKNVNKCKDEEIGTKNNTKSIKGTKEKNTVNSQKINIEINQKPVLLWLHGAGGTAALSFGLSGIIDRLGEEYDIYALDLPGFGRSTINWKDRKTKLNDIKGMFFFP